MTRTVLGATSRGAALALVLAVLGCAKPLATLDVAGPAAGRAALERSETEVSTPRSLRVVGVAKNHLGARYVWGGASPAGFDCSGFVMYVYRHAGVSLPHGAAKQYRLGTSVSRKHLAPGDIVFFDGLNHSGIYIGDGRFVHASKSGDTVKVSRLDEGWFERRWVGARRLLVSDRQALSED
jgi:cell wall-associated NlpC family hydrolase